MFPYRNLCKVIMGRSISPNFIPFLVRRSKSSQNAFTATFRNDTATGLPKSKYTPETKPETTRLSFEGVFDSTTPADYCTLADYSNSSCSPTDGLIKFFACISCKLGDNARKAAKLRPRMREHMFYNMMCHEVANCEAVRPQRVYVNSLLRKLTQLLCLILNFNFSNHSVWHQGTLHDNSLQERSQRLSLLNYHNKQVIVTGPPVHSAYNRSAFYNRSSVCWRFSRSVYKVTISRSRVLSHHGCEYKSRLQYFGFFIKFFTLPLHGQQFKGGNLLIIVSWFFK